MNSIRRHQGFTLIELMVGMVIGLLTTLVITQVMATAEGQRRTTSIGSSAQVNGALALYGLQHDLQMTGYGIAVVPAALGCPMRGKYASATPTLFPANLVPIAITDGGTAGSGSNQVQKPDSINLLSGSKAGVSVPALLTEDHPATGTSFVVQSSFSVTTGDLMLAVPGSTTTPSWEGDANKWCSLFQVTSTTTTAPISINNATNAGWNAAAVMPTAGYTGDGSVTSAYLLNFGSMVYRQYSVCDPNTSPNPCPVSVLRATDLNISTGAPVRNDAYSDIVNIQAMYGIDSDGDGDVDSYTNTTPTTNAGWRQVIALRLAVVSRSSVYEKEAVTGTPPTWSFLASSTDTAATTYKLYVPDTTSTAADPPWKHYRYRVYDTVVPLRNIVWNS